MMMMFIVTISARDLLASFARFAQKLPYYRAADAEGAVRIASRLGSSNRGVSNGTIKPEVNAMLMTNGLRYGSQDANDRHCK